MMKYGERPSLILYDMLTKLFYSQLFSILIVGCGIFIEYIYEADLGFMAISTGSLLFSLTTKVENYYLTKKKGKRHEHKSI
jgi:hypothetical protein